MTIPTALGSKHLRTWNKAIGKEKKSHANKQKEGEAAGDRSRSDGTWLMGTCRAWRTGAPPKQSGGQAVPPSKNCSYQTWPANWQARLLAPWFTDMAHSSSKFEQEVGGGAGRGLPSPLQYTQYTLALLLWTCVTLEKMWPGRTSI